MSDKKITAGFGRSQIVFPKELFPIEGFQGVHDLPCARIMALKSGREEVAICDLEMVNVPAKGIELCKKIITEHTAIPEAHIWVHVTHAITTMHEPGPMGPPDKRPPETEEDIRKRKLFYDALENAVTEAARQTAEDFSEARIGWGDGECDANKNRDVETPFGWWTGSDSKGPSNKKMTVLRVEKPDGTPKGFFISYGIKPCAIDNAGMKNGTRLVSSDVCGVCCHLMEEKYGVPALFGVSAAADQVPKETAWMEEVDEEGKVFVRDDGVEQGLIYVEKYGTEMGKCAIAIADSISCTETSAVMKCGKVSFQWPTRNNRGKKGPSKPQEWPDSGMCKVEAELFALGNTVFVAEKPEINCQTEKELIEKSAYERTILLCMVNGGMKYMPDKLGFERNSFEAQRSSLQPGAAEKFVEVVAEGSRNLQTDDSAN